jgi:hypothetical protein
LSQLMLLPPTEIDTDVSNNKPLSSLCLYRLEASI